MKFYQCILASRVKKMLVKSVNRINLKLNNLISILFFQII